MIMVHDRSKMSRTIFLILFLVGGSLICLERCKSSVRQSAINQPYGVFTFLTTRDGNFEIYSMNADGTNPINLSNNKAVDFWSSWSPDGKQILFYTNRDGNNEIYRMDADGKNPINISRVVTGWKENCVYFGTRP